MGHREAKRVGFWRGWACSPQAPTGMHVGRLRRSRPPLSGLFSERLCKPRKNKQCVKLSALLGNRHFLLPPLFSLNFAGVQAPFPATPSLSLGWIRRSLFSKVLEPKHQGVTQALQGPCSAGGSRPCPPFAWEVEGGEVREGSLKNLQK